MNNNKMWEYRVVRKESENGLDEWYSIQEVYYDDETGKPMAHTTDLQVEGDSISEMRKRLEGMIKCLEEPVLDEQDIVDTPTKTKTIEDRVLELGLENAEMRDRLTELGDMIEKTKKVRSL